MNRRQFTKAAGSGVLAVASIGHAKDEVDNSAERIVDIHQHINFHGRRNDELVRHQKDMGVSRTVLLPSGSALVRGSTHDGRSNGLAARVFGTEAAARLTAEHPAAFVYFCNEVPDSEGATKKLEKWLEKGALGIGESKFHLECDSAPMIRVYEIAKAYKVPVLLHFQHDSYNMGFERLPKVLERFPEVSFIGHAQTWWGNIDAAHDQTVMYPKGPVEAGGLTDRYLADYPNVFGDLSAGSGRNALNRDEEHAAAFLERHQDKLMLGTDCADTEGSGEKCSGSQQIDNVRRLVEDPKARAKIFSGNAERIIGVS
ncbi:MAG: amidohydrolase family protein [Verrucomicrobiales bacterium]